LAGGGFSRGSVVAREEGVACVHPASTRRVTRITAVAVRNDEGLCILLVPERYLGTRELERFYP
jgi:hypothetical protein